MVVSSIDVGTEDGPSPLYGMSFCKSLFKVRWEYFEGGEFMFKCLLCSVCSWIFVPSFSTVSGLVSERATVQICEHVLALQSQPSCCKNNYLPNTTSQCLFLSALSDRTTRHAGVRGNEIAYRLMRDGSVQRFVGPNPFLRVSRQNIGRKIKRWMENQHLVLWRGPCSTHRQARELISGPDLATKARMSFNPLAPEFYI